MGASTGRSRGSGCDLVCSYGWCTAEKGSAAVGRAEATATPREASELVPYPPGSAWLRGQPRSRRAGRDPETEGRPPRTETRCRRLLSDSVEAGGTAGPRPRTRGGVRRKSHGGGRIDAADVAEGAQVLISS